MKISITVIAALIASVAIFISPAASASVADNITYGHQIFVQNYGMDYRWLTGNRAPPGVVTRSILMNEDESGKYRHLYKLVIVSDLGSGSANEAVGNDPLFGECVKYGDVINIINANSPLKGSLGDASEDVETRDYYNDANEQYSSQYEWTIRSSPGLGQTFGNGNDFDPAHGLCVTKNSVVYIQHNSITRWLTGANGQGNENVFTRNLYQYEPDSNVPKFQWILSPEAGVGGTERGVQCPGVPGSATGSWTKVGSTNGGFTISTSMGTTATHSESITTSRSWETSITSTVSAGFSFAGASASAELSVSAGFSRSQERSVSRAVEQSKLTTVEFTFDEPGIVWQYIYSASDTCQSDLSILTQDVVLTPNWADRPCCLPGYALDPFQPHGPCVGDSPCTCSDDVCSGSMSGRRHLRRN